MQYFSFGFLNSLVASSQKVAYVAQVIFEKELTNHMMLTAQLFPLFQRGNRTNIRYAYLTTETSVPSSSATSGIAGMNEPETKTLSRVTVEEKMPQRD